MEKRDFVPWFRAEAPDVLCLQETKARPDQLSADLREPRTMEGEAYYAYWASARKAGYSGVAIFSRFKPNSVKPLGIDRFDDEGRVLVAEFADFTLICAYFPNSQDGGARLPYKLDFCAAMMDLCNGLVKEKRHFVLCGDYNIAHSSIDLARPRENEGSAGYLPEERAWMDSFIAAGHVDSFRHFHPGQTGHYSWWSYRAASRLRNVGWRIDYHCVDRALLDRVKATRIRSEVEGSDHCPVELELD